MEDLDLDELDQAVNKMMTKPGRAKRGHKKAADTAVAANPASGPITIASTPTPEPEPTPPKPAEPITNDVSSAAPTTIPVSRPMPKVPPRRRMHPGAMDIIQPNQPKMGAPSGTPSRMGRDVAPVMPVTPEPPKPVETPEPARVSVPPRAPEDEAVDVADEVLASLTMHDEPTPPKTITKPITTPVPTPPAPKKDADNNWPDPLDFHDFADDKPKDEPKEPAPTMEQKQPNPDALLDDAAASTPFVKTKVEKRPLGAYADMAYSPEDKKEEKEETEDTDKPETVSVTDQAPSKGEMAAASIQSNQHLEKSDDTETDMNQLRNMSIPQQYHTAEQKPSEEVHSMFDTKEYHAAPQQIGHPAKKGGSAWFVIMVIVLIVLLVAAVAVGYLMMTGTLDLSKIL